MRMGAFPAPDEGLDEAGLRRALTRRIDGSAWLTSPALAARQTTEALHVTAEVEDALRDIDHGAWTGSTFEAVQAADPAGLAAWLDDDIAPLAAVALSFNRLWRLQAIRPDEGAAP